MDIKADDPRDADFQWHEVKLGFTVTQEDIPHYVYRWVPFWSLNKWLTEGWERHDGFWPLYRLRRVFSLFEMIESAHHRTALDQSVFTQ